MKKNINKIHIENFWYLPILLVLGLLSCKEMEGYNEPVSTDKTKPGIVTNVIVDNFSGGAHITYTLPNAENLLYVMAEYKINDEISRQTKSSYYADTITVEGFAESQEYEVTLYAVSRANVTSDPVTVKVFPETPYYKTVKSSVQISADFGGVNITANNPNRQPLGFILLEMDPTVEEFDVQDQHYDNAQEVAYSVRGYDTQPRKFGVYVTDRFGNRSDTIVQTIAPLFETILDKSKFYTYNLPRDTEIGYGWNLSNLWDEKTDGHDGWHTNPGEPQPIYGTFGLGTLAQLSRFVMWNRGEEFAYSHGNPKRFTLWGSDKDSPQEAELPEESEEGTVVGDWINLGNFRFPDPPSGMPAGSATPQDIAFVEAGVNFNFSITNPKVKYLRLDITETWSGGDFAHVMELSVYGDPE